MTSNLEPSSPRRALIVVPTLNEALHIERCIESLTHDDPVARASRMIVADGGSTDGTCDLVERLRARHPNLELRHNPGRIQAAALNLALAPEFDGYDILVRCDAHSVYSPRFVEQVVRSLAEKDVASVVVPMDALAEGGCFRRALGWVADTPLGAGGSAHRGGRVSGFVEHGHHAGFRLDVFRELGGYDTAFAVNEDAEYDRRLRAAGHRIWLDADIRIGYVPRPTPQALARQYFRYGAGRARTCLKHRVMPQPRQAIPAANLVVLGLSVAALPFSMLGIVWPAIYGALLAGTSLAATLAMRSTCGLNAGVAVGIIHNAWGAGFLGHFLRHAAQRSRGGA